MFNQGSTVDIGDKKRMLQWNGLFVTHLGFEKISRPSLDPSPPLSFWDKMRHLIHGQLTMEIHQLTVLLHASLDPYNTTEEMEVTWSSVVMDWTNGMMLAQVMPLNSQTIFLIWWRETNIHQRIFICLERIYNTHFLPHIHHKIRNGSVSVS